jgi:CBS domain-containing protein
LDTPEKHRAQAKEAAINAQDPIAGRPAGPPDLHDTALGFETSDARFGPVVRALVGVVIMAAIAFAVTTGMQALFTGDLGTFTPIVANEPQNPVPEVIESRAATGVESHELRAIEFEQLSTYGWVDEGAGVVRIPIDRAMELIAEQNLPARPDAEFLDYYRIPLDSSSGRTLERTFP